MTMLLPRPSCAGNSLQPVNTNISLAAAFLVLGLAVVSYAATLNVRPVLAQRLGLLDTILEGGLPIIATLAFAGLPVVVSWLWRRQGARGFALFLGLLTLVAGLLSVSNIIGATYAHRLTAADGSKITTDGRVLARATITAAQAEMATLGAPRAGAIVQAEINAVYTRTPGLTECRDHDPNWRPTRAHREACKLIGALEIERATAARKTTLDDQIAEARATLGERKVVTNGTALAIVDAARKIGGGTWGDQADALETVELALSVLVAFVVESVAASLFVLADFAWVGLAVADRCNGRDSMPSNPSAGTVPEWTGPQKGAVDAVSRVSNEGPAESAGTPENTGSDEVFSGVQSLAVPADPSGRLLQLVIAHGGEVFGGHRSFARALGISPGHVANVLAKLSSEGVVGVETTKRGTRVRLRTAKASA